MEKNNILKLRPSVAVVKEDGDNTIYCLQFCGYYPSDNPQYSIIVSLNKKGLPASGGMAGEIVKHIVEFISITK